MTDIMQTKVQGVTVDVTAPYAEGHTLTAAEAKALNQYRAALVTGNVSQRIKNGVLEGCKFADMDAEHQSAVAPEVQKVVTESDTGFTFSMESKRGAGRKSDPFEAEVKSIAKDLVKKNIKRKGGSLGEYKAKQLSDMAAKVLANPDKRKQIEAKAKQVIKQREQLDALELDLEM